MPADIREQIDDLAGSRKPAGADVDRDDREDREDREPQNAHEESESGKIKELIEELVKFDIILPPDTTEDDFFDRLLVGLKTAAAHQGLDDERNGSPLDTDTTVADAGGVAMLSLQAQTALNYAERQHRSAVEATLQSLLNSGRCTPAEFHERKSQVPTLRLSLDDSGEPQPSDLEKWLASRQPLPRGTFWDAEQRSTRLSATVEVEEPPTSAGAGESPEKVNAVLAAVFGQRK